MQPQSTPSVRSWPGPFCRECAAPMNASDRRCGWCDTERLTPPFLERLTPRQLWLISIVLVFGFVLFLFGVCIVLAYSSTIEVGPGGR